ncbi:MAG: helix-turn-helix transcriptional regulator [Bacillota bacterium]|jgi:CBS domain-containing protein/biotin operon repressor
MTIKLSPRQEKIVELVKDHGPISGELLAQHLNVTRAALRPDLAILTMAGLLDARPRVGYTYSGKTLNFLSAERLRLVKVREVCSVPVVINEERSLYDAVVSMFLEDVGTLIVVDEEGYLAGVVSRSDLLKSSIGSLDLEKVPVGVVMTRLANVVHVGMDDTLLMAAHKMVNHRVNTLPVVKPADEEGRLSVVGTVSQRTMTKIFVEIAEGR